MKMVQPTFEGVNACYSVESVRQMKVINAKEKCK